MKPLLTSDMYRHTLTELRLSIENEYKTVQKFAQQHKINLENLYRIFAKEPKQEISVGMFLKINWILGTIPVEPTPAALASKLSLREYLEIDNNMVIRSVLAINYYKPTTIKN